MRPNSESGAIVTDVGERIINKLIKEKLNSVLLEQVEAWRDRDGHWYLLHELTNDHLDNIISYLDDRSREYRSQFMGVIYDFAHPRPRSHTSTRWMHERPLYRALVEERSRREEHARRARRRVIVAAIDGFTLDGRPRLRAGHMLTFSDFGDCEPPTIDMCGVFDAFRGTATAYATHLVREGFKVIMFTGTIDDIEIS